ncbi:MAG: hypothetical protein V5A44_10340 [Haloarculaceae archaeon]
MSDDPDAVLADRHERGPDPVERLDWTIRAMGRDGETVTVVMSELGV